MTLRNRLKDVRLGETARWKTINDAIETVMAERITVPRVWESSTSATGGGLSAAMPRRSGFRVAPDGARGPLGFKNYTGLTTQAFTDVLESLSGPRNGITVIGEALSESNDPARLRE